MIEVAGARRTTARRAGGAIREVNQAFGRVNSYIIGLHKGDTGKDLYIQVCPIVEESLVSPMSFSGDDSLV